MPFLKSLFTPLADNSLSITVYHKLTHTDQYLQWDSHHNLSTKYSIIVTLTHRAKIVCTRPEVFQTELQHLRDALARCKYPNWAINRVQSKYIKSNQEDYTNHNNNQEDNNTQDIHNPRASTEEDPHIMDSTNTSQDNPQSMYKQRIPLYKAKTKHRICGYPLHPKE